MTDIILVIVLLAVVTAAARYVYKAKKSGAKCIGCSVEGGCAHRQNVASGCGCGCDEGTDTCGCHTESV